MDVDQNSESGDRHAYAEDGEAEAMLSEIGQCGYQHSKSECCGPWRHGVQLSLDGAVSIPFDDTFCDRLAKDHSSILSSVFSFLTWTEVGIAISRNDQTKVHEAGHDDLVVFQDISDILERNRSFQSRFTLIKSQSSSNILSFAFREPFSLFGERRDGKEEDDCNYGCERSLEDEAEVIGQSTKNLIWKTVNVTYIHRHPA